MKEGAIDTLWRLQTDGITKSIWSSLENVYWEQIKTSGTGPGQISHHKCAVIGDIMYLIGGLKGESSNDTMYCLNLKNHQWSAMTATVNHLLSFRETSLKQEMTILSLSKTTRRSLFLVDSNQETGLIRCTWERFRISRSLGRKWKSALGLSLQQELATPLAF